MALFTPFRALGYITSDVPPAVQRRGAETFITVSVGKSWQIYNAQTLRLVLVGPQYRRSINAIACKGDLTFSAVGSVLFECRRVHTNGRYEGHEGDIISILVLGDMILTLGRDQRLLVWRIGRYDEPNREIILPQGFVPTCLLHPETYLNKVVVGSDDGRMQLWNFSTGKMIHEFASFGSSVRCLASSPALDVVGIGLADGRALLHNLRYDEMVAEFNNAAGAGTDADMYLTNSAAREARKAIGTTCTALAFRTTAGIPLMAAGGGSGVITLWNLEERRLHSTIRDAHDAPITSLHFFKGEPVMLSAGADNTLKEWIFDGPDGTGRLLRFRSGHAAPPTIVRHYGPDGRWLLSAGQDRAFRCFSTIQDAQSRELSQGHTKRRAKRLRISEIELKLGRIVALDACDVRERDWSNVLTAHYGDTNAYVWRLQNFALGEHILAPPPKEQLDGRPLAPVTAVAVSRCGNFGLVGSASGRLDRYNMQSGLHRGVYRRSSDNINEEKRLQGTVVASLPAHDGSIQGLSTDASNRYTVSAGLDGAVRVWNFTERTLVGQVLVGSPVTLLAHHCATGLVAVACDDMIVRMIDVETQKRVRRFRGHTDRITDIQISSDCRWLLSTSMDNTLRVWDIPGAQVLQVLRLGSPVTSVSLSPSQDLLATTHVEHNGVYLWANQLIFGSGADVIPSEKPINARLPAPDDGNLSFEGSETERVSRMKKLSLDIDRILKHSTLAAGSSSQKNLDGRYEPSSMVSSPPASSFDSSALSSSEAESSDAESVEEGKQRTSHASGNMRSPMQDIASEPHKYALKDSAGAPVPIVPNLATLSMLPRTQWLNLVHLDTIKIRNKPIEPPKKPEAAPFFLPTMKGANAGRDPVFDTSQARKEDKQDGGDASGAARDDRIAKEAMAAWGGGSDDEEEGEEEMDIAVNDGDGEGNNDMDDVDHGIKSRVVRNRLGADGNGKWQSATDSKLVSLLRRCSDAGDWTSLLGYLREASPTEVDRELRSMQLLEAEQNGDDAGIEEAKDAEDLQLWLQFLEATAGSNANFEFLQALLKATLSIHGEVIMLRPGLRAAAKRIEARIAKTWERLGRKIAQARCVVALLGSLQS